MAKTDKDFDNIRDDPRFKKLIESDWLCQTLK
jgi:hypothetical protein